MNKSLEKASERANEKMPEKQETVPLPVGRPIKIRIDLKSGLPVFFPAGKELKAYSGIMLADLCRAEDLRFVTDELGRIAAQKDGGTVNAHFRVGEGGEQRWMLLTADLIRQSALRSAHFDGYLMDVTNYLEATQSDTALVNFRSRNAKMGRAVSIDSVVDIGLLRKLQSHFDSEGSERLRCALYNADGSFVCAARENKGGGEPIFSPERYEYVYRADVRIARDSAAYFLLCGNERLVRQHRGLLDLLADMLSRLSTAYVLLAAEMENSATANRQLGENIENQILINTLYNISFDNEPAQALYAVMIQIGEYMRLSRIRLYLFNVYLNRYELDCEWHAEENAPASPREIEIGQYPDMFEELSFADMFYPANERHELAAEGVKSFYVAAIGQPQADGTHGGLIFYDKLNEFWTPEARESKILREASHILAGQVNRAKMNTEIERINDRLHKLAFNDSVMQIPNRAQLDLDLAGELRKKGGGALVALRITNMRIYNELFGQDYSDRLMGVMARYISGLMQNRLTNHNADNAGGGEHRNIRGVYRFSGNLFFVMLRRAETEEAVSFTRSVMSRFSKPFSLPDDEGSGYYLDAGAGIVFYPNDGDTPEALYRVASLAMYRASDFGTNNIAVYHEEFLKIAESDFALTNLLRQSIENGMEGFFIRMQPEFSAKSAENREIIGYEALTSYMYRQVSPEGEITETEIKPARLIALAESTGFDLRLDAWSIERACEFCVKKNKNVTVSVNVTGRELRTGAICRLVEEALDKTRLNPERLYIEVRPGAAFDPAAIATLSRLKQLGVRITLDDFGRMPPPPEIFSRALADRVKCDIGVFAEEKDEVTEILFAALMAIAHKTRDGVFVKRVEAESEMDRTAGEEIAGVQGFAFGKPE
jgi:EAL domain-containing protein (putative c-di-GMP-specific phosphodiesterase class I)/GGDEF domain-containing protein